MLHPDYQYDAKEIPEQASQISPIRGIKYGKGIFYELRKYKRERCS